MAPDFTDHTINFQQPTDNGLTDAEYKFNDVLGGRYRVLALLGRGGMGVVYKVEQIFLGKELALKTIDRRLMSDVAVRRFNAEARAAFAVNHANVVSMYDFGLFEDQTPFLVMEIVQGETLGDRLRKGILSTKEAVDIFIQVCFGLAHAHESGVVHRDIKPNNIMLLNDVHDGIEPSVKILDFGIAKIAQHDGGEVQALTRTGEIFGSPLYMSPEQCAGRKVDARADVYSLGCVIFESLTGTPPFVGENALATMMLHQNAVAPTLKEASLGADYPPELERIIARMLAKAPDERYQNLGKAALDLSALKQGEPAQSNALINLSEGDNRRQISNTVTLNRDTFRNAMLALALATFALSSWVTYFTGAAQVSALRNRDVENIQKSADAAANRPTTTSAVSKTIGTDATLADNAGVSEDQLIFLDDVKKGKTTFDSKFAGELSFSAFKGYKDAQALLLQDSPVSDTALKNLRDSKLLALSVNNCIIDGLDEITNFANLQQLDLTRTKITDADLPKLSKLKMLRALSIPYCDISDQGLLQLIPVSSLVCVSLTPGRYSEKTLATLHEKMPQCMFIPYKQLSKFDEIRKQNQKSDKIALNEKLLSLAQKNDPESVQNYWLMTQLSAEHAAQHHKKLADEFLIRANRGLERKGDLFALSTNLLSEARNALDAHNVQKAMELNDRSLQYYLDTHEHEKNRDLIGLLFMYSDIPVACHQFDRSAQICRLAIEYMDRFPSLKKDLMLTHSNRVAWSYRINGKKEAGLPYARRALGLIRPQSAKHPDEYARALIEYAHCLNDNDSTEKIVSFTEGVELLEKLKLPSQLNLQAHYCDACAAIATIKDREGDYNGAITYLRKALAATMKMQPPDSDNREINFKRMIVGELIKSGHKAQAVTEAARFGIKL